MISAAEVLTNWDLASRHEWLVTNGIGGYASGSLAGANTRRYHGMLVAAAQPPLGRVVLLSKLEEEVRIEDQLYCLGASKYPSVIFPQGYRHLQRVSCDPVLTFVYSLHEHSVVLQKQVWMPHGQNTVFVQYALLKAPEAVRFALVPFMAYKDYHSEQHRWDGFAGRTDSAGAAVVFTAYDGAMPVRFSAGPEHTFTFNHESGWFYNYEHEREQERGLDFTEDLFCPGRFDGMLAPGKTATFYATVEPEEIVPDIHQSLRDEIERRQALETASGLKAHAHDHDALRTLVKAADQFVIESSPRVSRATIIAGYHWFTDWGRDTFISLPGLCLATGRSAVAREIIASFAGSLKDGLIPNRFTDNGFGAEYNTVDATLWYVYAAHAYARVTEDWEFLTGEMLPIFEQILDAHRAGTMHSIYVDPDDGLLHAGEPGVQLTWMDAKVGDWVVTPRTGKPVEIQALYYNALCLIADVQRRAGKADAASKTQADADRLRGSFLAKFVDQERGVLYDVVDVPGLAEPDASLRPNQVFAISLHYPLVDPASDLARSIVTTLRDRLYTDYGLRTLDPADPNYKGAYGPGDQMRRDSAYHQGTVWPWLVGHFVEAHLKVFGDRSAALDLLSPLLRSLDRYGIGTLNEIYDGDEPHAPNGCIAQAWSVAEAIRAYTLIKDAPASDASAVSDSEAAARPTLAPASAEAAPA